MFAAFGLFMAATLSAAPVLNGIDVLVRENFRPLAGKTVGLITNASGHDRRRCPTIDLLHGAEQVELAALFSPEHGIRGDLDQAEIADGIDPSTGLPIHSLYGERRAPSAAQLDGLDALVFDVQDVGCRFYTYVSTLNLAMEAAGKAGVEMVVLDRVNPIGPAVEGPVLSEPRSFVGTHEIPLRHGMTLGELARLIAGERNYPVALRVVACEGGDPLNWFDRTGQPWTRPSPNLRSPTAALLYPGVAILEFCPVSVGRGTATPFEHFGAPWIDDVGLAAALNAAGLPGVRFTPVTFTPESSVHAGRLCRGVRFTVTDRDAFRAVDLGIVLATELQRRHPQKLELEKALRLLGDRPTLEAIRAGKPLGGIRRLWAGGLAEFERRRRPYLLYPRKDG